MERFVKDQIKYGLKYIPKSLVKYPFEDKTTNATEKLRSNGFICGVCHPSDDYKQMTAANINWVRFDMPFPFDENFKLTADYESFKQRCKKFKENGINVMTITPYPHDFTDRGIDVRTAVGKEKLKETARFLISDLQGCVSGIQVTNEMGIPHFTLPLNMNEAAEYIGLQLQEMYPLKGDIIIGYNSGGPQADLHYKMTPYLKYCDYVGIDIYIGCFFHGYMWMFDAMLSYLWTFTKKPIILMEFGYISKGAPKTKKDKLETLKKYGAKNEKDARENIASFLSNLPEFMQKHIKNVTGNDESRYFSLIFKSDFKTHLYKELPKLTVIPGYPHTYDGQAKFYKDILPRLYKKPFLAGAFVYSYSDAQACHICGENDCPTETKWGLTERNGKEKPSYYAVKEAFGQI